MIIKRKVYFRCNSYMCSRRWGLHIGVRLKYLITTIEVLTEDSIPFSVFPPHIFLFPVEPL